LEHAPEGITIATAPDVQIVRVSRYAEELTGRSRTALYGIPAAAHPDALALYHMDGVTMAAADELPLTRATVHGEVIRGEEWMLRGTDGAMIPVLCNAAPIRDATDTIIGGLILWRDIQDLKQRQERLQRLEADAQAERRAAEDMSRVKGDFLSRMAHELRTPLQSIQGHIAVMERGLHGPVTDGQGHALGRVQFAVRHMTGLINDVLHYAQLEARRVTYQCGRVDLCGLVPELRAMIDPQRRAKAITWTEEPQPGPCLVIADREKLVQVMLNLYSNAVKFTAPGGRVTVRALLGSDWTTVEVEDTGVGIAADRVDTIFEPFVHGAAAESAGQAGTGLGLTISRDLARGMGGDLTVESEVGRGTTFRLRLRSA
jgi:PAS domain S-box-containing protein